MNYLAHLLLSGDDPNILVGNFIADFVKKKEEALFSEEIQKGFRIHRKIDEFTDNHPSVALGKALIRAKHSKYAPVILDIHYDHLLYKNWDRICESTQHGSRPLAGQLQDKERYGQGIQIFKAPNIKTGTSGWCNGHFVEEP
jgi:acyl carrier protein phosphodiesterase